ncbi:unnamed protein product [Macrosiphum euphorbiae]|uniref:Endonuclease/exonuclease/phosphatase domain-containing protein n=1 Tax=Macrosiphum euphorbiae TaxID=13131 RepID=A0AAV0W042_9HEMI|nr:unnamed protein product [Macrosiphum euphorbiae]
MAKIIQWNLNGFFKKQEELKLIIQNHDPQIICLQETNFKDNFTAHLKNYEGFSEYSILYLFVRYKFGWNEIDYSLYAAYKMTGILIGTILAIWLMSVKLKMHDAAIGFIGSSFDLIAAVCYSFVTQPWQLYAVPVIDIFHGAAFTVSTSMASKLVDNSELAQLNSVRGMLETLAPIIIYPLYNQLYKLTFETLPGAFFLLTAVITVPVVILFGLTYKADQKDNIFKNNEDDVVAPKNKDECNNTVKEESIKTIDSV